MKKLSVLLVVFILSAGFVFAQEEEAEERQREIEAFNLEVNIGFPVHWTNGRHDSTFYPFNPVNPAVDPTWMSGDKTVTANTAIGMAMVFNATKHFGFILDMDLFYGAKVSGFSSPTSDQITLFGANAFLGPLFYLINDGALRIPFSFGAHFYYFYDELWVPGLNYTPALEGQWINRTDLQLGGYVSIGIQYHFNSDIYIFTRTVVAIDFFRIHTLTGLMEDYDNPGDMIYRDVSHMDWDINWSIKPSIGIGIKF